MVETNPHLEVDLTLLPTEQSGRRAPIYTGFQSLFEYDGGEGDTFHTLEQQEFAFPGDRVRVLVTFRRPEPHLGRLVSGKAFRLRDAGQVIGHGTVRRIFNLGCAPRPL
jgi:translation elongation factor EF-Tu-like GTPase